METAYSKLTVHVSIQYIDLKFTCGIIKSS